MAGKSGDSTEVISEGENRVKGDTKERIALSPFKEHPNRFGAA